MASSQVWTSVCHVFLFSLSIFKHFPWPSPAFICTFLPTISSCNMKLGRNRSERENVGSLQKIFQLSWGSELWQGVLQFSRSASGFLKFFLSFLDCVPWNIKLLSIFFLRFFFFVGWFGVFCFVCLFLVLFCFLKLLCEPLINSACLETMLKISTHVIYHLLGCVALGAGIG